MSFSSGTIYPVISEKPRHTACEPHRPRDLPHLLGGGILHLADRLIDGGGHDIFKGLDIVGVDDIGVDLY